MTNNITSFQAFACLHELLLSDFSLPILKVNNFSIKEKQSVLVSFETEEDENTQICVPVNTLHQSLKYQRQILNFCKMIEIRGNVGINVVASKSFLGSLDIQTDRHYSKIGIESITDIPLHSKKEYFEYLDFLNRFKYKSRLEKQALLMDVKSLKNIRTFLDNVSALKCKISDTQLNFLKERIASNFLEVNFDQFLETIIFYYNFRVLREDQQKIELLFLRMTKIWLSLGYNIPNEFSAHFKDFIERCNLTYCVIPTNKNGFASIAKTLLTSTF